jgi:ABC-2 type transport system permease protein
VFSGVFFPPQLLPGAMQQVSKILPATYGLTAIRGILIENNGLNEAREPIITLLIFLAVLLPLSLWIFSRAVRRAKREGSLIQY